MADFETNTSEPIDAFEKTGSHHPQAGGGSGGRGLPERLSRSRHFKGHLKRIPAITHWSGLTVVGIKT